MVDKSLLRYGENELVEKPSIEVLEELGWTHEDCFDEFISGESTLSRGSRSEVVLVDRLLKALTKLNPQLPEEALVKAAEEVASDRSAMSLAAANQQVYELIKAGVKVSYRNDDDEEVTETARLIAWDAVADNDFFVASQFWITGKQYTRRPDLTLFVNGIPLVLIELKAPQYSPQNGFDDNITDYKDTIPSLFWYNAFMITSNGAASKLGSTLAPWEHFCDWKKINSEGEEGVVALDTMLRGTCDPEKLLDLVENFLIFQEKPGELIKICAKNHQYLGVGNAIGAVEQIKENQGKLGVFWHTQGSGKSISMIFFAQRILRKLPGHWTFVIVTDRKELDRQIYKEFASAGVVTEDDAQASSGEHLRKLLSEDHRYVFTLIQKFQLSNRDNSPSFEEYPMLSDRSNIIVITDEAHRSQYAKLASNMRKALPNAAFLAFTGTPLIDEEDHATKELFGDYVSIYNFQQSVEDGATVPLYYENRIPELQLINEEGFGDELGRIVDNAVSSVDDAEEQVALEKKLEKEFAREYHLITREERLEAVAADLSKHFVSRGFRGKAMVVCIDKATAVRMHDKVQKYWQQGLKERKERVQKVDTHEQDILIDEINFMQETEMAVVVSQAQNEIRDMKAKGLDIGPHRQKLVDQDMEARFKDKDDPFRLVFVCAMWMTGFDVPSCSTIYMDKPMRNHTLMQTITRANRKFKEKVCGTIVDYIGVFKNLNKALAIWGKPSKGKNKRGRRPANPKDDLVEELREAIAETVAFCSDQQFDLTEIPKSPPNFERVKLVDEAVNCLLVNDDVKTQFRSLAATVGRLYKAILPDHDAGELTPLCLAIAHLAKNHLLAPPEIDISSVMQEVEDLLDRSIAAEGYVIDVDKAKQVVDLSQIDFETLRKKFAASGHKRMEAALLRQQVHAQVHTMVRQNRTRTDYLEKFQKMIDEYNTGSVNIEEFFKRLVEFSRTLNEEEKRGLSEGLSEEELAMFDLLTKPGIELTEKEEKKVKQVAKDLLEKLKRDKLVLDWRKHQRTRAAVKVSIRDELDKLPEDPYPEELYDTKIAAVYEHVYEAYSGKGESIYAEV